MQTLCASTRRGAAAFRGAPALTGAAPRPAACLTPLSTAPSPRDSTAGLTLARHYVRHRFPGDLEAAASTPGRLPAIARALIDAACPTLWAAPCGPGVLDRETPALRVLDAKSDRATLLTRIEQERPRALVVCDRDIDAGVIAALREAALPDQAALIRRGTSIDRIDVAAAVDANVCVKNLPGVNAPHVAAVVLRLLRGADGSLPAALVVVGYGAIGREVTRQFFAAVPHGTVTLLVRREIDRTELGAGIPAERVRVSVSATAALHAARAVALCPALSASALGMVDAPMIAALAPGARVVNVAKPEVFTDAALRHLAQRPDLEFVQDYGPHTLAQLRSRLDTLGIPPRTWQQAPQLISTAVQGTRCNEELDRGTGLALAQHGITLLVRRKLADPDFTLAVPAAPAKAQREPRPIVHVLGRGTGLLHALVLSNAGMQPVVWGKRTGASFHGDMRYLSITETLAVPGTNAALDARANDFILTMNRAGLALWRRFIADNPALAHHFRTDRVLRIWDSAEDDGGEDSLTQMMHHVGRASVPWPGDASDAPIALSMPRAEQLTRALDPTEIAARYGMHTVARGLDTHGYELALAGFLEALEARLRQAGVRIIDAELNARQVANLTRQDGNAVVRATGTGLPDLAPTLGWVVTLPAVGKEGAGPTGVKIMHADPRIGVLNVRHRDDGLLEIAGGMIDAHAAPAEQHVLQQSLLEVVARHYPASWEASRQDGGKTLRVMPCVRPSTADGVPVVDLAGPRHVIAGGAHKGGFTQVLAHALIATELLQKEMGAPATPPAVEGVRALR